MIRSSKNRRITNERYDALFRNSPEPPKKSAPVRPTLIVKPRIISPPIERDPLEPHPPHLTVETHADLPDAYIVFENLAPTRHSNNNSANHQAPIPPFTIITNRPTIQTTPPTAATVPTVDAPIPPPAAIVNQQSSNNDLARRQRRYRPLRPDPEIFNLDDIDIAIDHQRVNPRPPRLDIESIDIDERTTLNHPTLATTGNNLHAINN